MARRNSAIGASWPAYIAPPSRICGALESDEIRIMSEISPAELSVLDRALDPRPASAFRATVTSRKSVRAIED